MVAITVPPGATPGVLTSETMVSLDAVCNVGSRAGTRDGSVSAWVCVCITPLRGAGGSETQVTPDSCGRFMHVVVEFVQPPEWIGKRRREDPGWSTTPGPGTLKVECDPGIFWIGTWARLHAAGGTPGDVYDVTITMATMQQEADARLQRGDDPPFGQVDVFEPSFQFTLTSLSTADVDNPNVLLEGACLPAHHTGFRLLQGTATWGGFALTQTGNVLSLNAPITTGVNTIYQTCGGV